MKTQQTRRQTVISENVLEIEYGMKMTEWEEFSLNFVNDNNRFERTLSFKKDHLILVFYVGVEELVSLKVFDITKNLTRSTTYFPLLGLRDIPAIVKLIS